ncbi:hypothetical protein Tco_0983120 [Tanacetum coccineum]
MAALTFADSHNMVAYLEKSEANADFVKMVDFLNASPISYALTAQAYPLQPQETHLLTTDSPTLSLNPIPYYWGAHSTHPKKDHTNEETHQKQGALSIPTHVKSMSYLDLESDEVVQRVEGETGIGSGVLEGYLHLPSDSTFPRVNNYHGSERKEIELRELMDMYPKLSNQVRKMHPNMGVISVNIEDLNVAGDEHIETQPAVRVSRGTFHEQSSARQEETKRPSDCRDCTLISLIAHLLSQFQKSFDVKQQDGKLKLQVSRTNHAKQRSTYVRSAASLHSISKAISESRKTPITTAERRTKHFRFSDASSELRT